MGNQKQSKRKSISSPTASPKKKARKVKSSAAENSNDKPVSILQEFFRGEELLNIQSLWKDASEDDPPVIFLRREVTPLLDEIAEIVDNEAHHMHNMVMPFPLPNPLTPETYKAALLNYLRAPGAAAPQSNGCFPCTGGQVGVVGGRAVGLSVHPWFLAYSNARGNEAFPLAEIMVPRPRSTMLMKACESVPHGVPMWA
jgi:hypothetical protein